MWSQDQDYTLTPTLALTPPLLKAAGVEAWRSGERPGILNRVEEEGGGLFKHHTLFFFGLKSREGGGRRSRFVGGAGWFLFSTASIQSAGDTSLKPQSKHNTPELTPNQGTFQKSQTRKKL